MTRWLLLSLALAGCDDSASSAAEPDADHDASTQDARVSDAAADASAQDEAVPDAAPDAAPDAIVDLGPPPTVDECFASVVGELGPVYEPYDPVIGHHCKGTNHQDIVGVERVVFLGDSVTAGTPPSSPAEVYRALLGEMLMERFGPDLVIDNCSEFGARTDDFLIGKGEIGECFPEGGDERVTLTIFTIGGNDIAAWAQDALEVEAAIQAADDAADLLDDAVAWLKDPMRFPAGSFVVYANPYEYTDATGDLESCELAALADLAGNWISGAPAVIRFQERFMEVATRYGADMVFSLEHFCGHGFHNEDPESQCYRGPGTEQWFDLTCIHPNPAGHAALADLFIETIDQ